MGLFGLTWHIALQLATFGVMESQLRVAIGGQSRKRWCSWRPCRRLIWSCWPLLSVAR